MSFDANSTGEMIVEGHDLSGKTVVVTGGNTGIGRETARLLAGAGADVVIGVRDLAAGRKVAEEMAGSGGPVRAMPLDLADLGSVRRFADTFRAHHRKLDILINNAGISRTPDSHLHNGWERRFAVNHLGHFLLADLLRDALLAAAPARLVILASSAHHGRPVIFDDIHFRNRPFDVSDAYGQSKTANILHAVAWSDRFAGLGVPANAVHPGFVASTLHRHQPEDWKVNVGLVGSDGAPGPDVHSVETGAATSLWAALAPGLEQGGLYLEQCRIGQIRTPASPPATGVEEFAIDRSAAERLWTISEGMVRAG